jgi:hypothetical protein
MTLWLRPSRSEGLQMRKAQHSTSGMFGVTSLVSYCCYCACTPVASVLLRRKTTS